MDSFLQDTINKNGFVVPVSIADKLHVSIKDIAFSTGLDASSLENESLIQTDPIQKRLKEMIDILDKTISWSNNVNQAYVWYQSVSLPSFGKLTAMDLVKQGKASAVIQYLERTDKGGFC